MNLDLLKNLKITAKNMYLKEISQLSDTELHNVISKVIMGKISENWHKAQAAQLQKKQAFYFSAEFLMGRLVQNNLLALGLTDKIKFCLKTLGINLNKMECIEDMALGNGGLGRLAACFLDSAATHKIPLNGYGIRYQYGLFKQSFVDGKQVETSDNWKTFGDPWSIKSENDSVFVEFADLTVKAVPYDVPIIGYKSNNINTLRLWQSEPINEFNFKLFNEQKYAQAADETRRAHDICKILYPNDSTDEGKKLRLRQQYFFCSASLQDILKKFKSIHGNKSNELPNFCAIQLNDTHPVISIPELIRLLLHKGVSFEAALSISQKIFFYTNHTVMSEALETWDTALISEILPEIFSVILKINEKLINELKLNTNSNISDNLLIIQDKKIHMARLAFYISKYTNGVAKIHTDILKTQIFKDLNLHFPHKIKNITNGITPRRWLALSNPELSALISSLISDNWITDLTKLEKLKKFCSEPSIIKKFNSIKEIKKQQLCDYIKEKEGEFLRPDFIFDVQIKRMHEYKRQLLNAFSILEIYFRIKDGELQDFYPTAFIFGGKAAPGYTRAKSIIKYINEIKNLINNDPDVNNKMKVIFVSNYDVSYAEKIIPAADISEQISTAGTEASGTGNMKLMLNGAVTLGTFDGANIEIVKQAGLENNYIFGATVDEINILKNNYNPQEIYDKNLQIRRILNTLVDGTFDSGSPNNTDFQELFDSILKGASWHAPDAYFLLQDLPDYVKTKIKAINDYKNRFKFGQMCLKNVASAGFFSSDRAIKEYAENIWKI